MKKFLYALLFATLPTLISAQTIVADRVRLNTGPCVLRSGSGSPEGVLVGNICDMYINTATGVWYTKWTGTGNTGWGVGHNAAARINGNTDITGYVSVPGYVSQLTGWRIDAAGAGDFRYLYTDELHAKSFIADLEQALAGGQIICKSVTSLGANFTNPATGGTATLTVRDLPSAPDIATFQSGDYVGLRVFTRAAGSLTIGDTFGVVTSYADQANGVQTWTFTRGAGANGGGVATSTVIQTDAIVIDYGVSGNGCHEVNALDGANSVNSPYAQTWNWTTSPIVANRSVRTRVGNLKGITGFTGDYGVFGGIFGTGSAAHYFTATNNGLSMYGADINLYESSTLTMRLNPAVPSFAIGNAIPTAYGTGTGIWMGLDSGAYKFRVGNPAGNRMTWDGSSLTIVGDGGGVTNINGANIQTGTVSATQITVGSGLNLLRDPDCNVNTGEWTPFSNATGAGTFAIATSLASYRLQNLRGTCYVTWTGTPAVSTQSQGNQTELISVVAGNKYEASAYLGVHRSGNSQVAINWYNTAGTYLTTSYGNNCTTANAGGDELIDYCRSGVIIAAPATATKAQFLVNTFHVGGGGGANPYLFWVHAFFGEALVQQTELSPWGPPGITEITGNVIKTGSIYAINIAAATITATEIAANTITAAKIAAGTITATEIAANTITAAKLNVTTLSAITANMGTLTAGTITGVTISGSTINAGSSNEVVLTSTGITIASGTGTTNKVKWSAGAEIFGRVDGSLYMGANGAASFLDIGNNVSLIANGVLTIRGFGGINLPAYTGGGNRVMCVDNSGGLFMGASNTAC